MKSIHGIRERVVGCWMGKAVGGTLGMPFEGCDGPFDLHFYDPIPQGMVANDDLDLQVLWACVLDRMAEPRVDRQVLADAWLEHVQFPWCEYGVAIRNLRQGIRPPLSGSHDNWFTCGMGAAIRSEIWACLAAGDPALAAQYAYEDACVDHAGDGIWAPVFLAALQAAAFVETDRDVLLDSALMRLPVTSMVRQCVNDTRLWWANTGDWQIVRENILRHYGHEDFTNVTMNMGFTVLGWLAGGNDFGRSVCIATNCGKDTDCTAATLGALLGILAPGDIPDEWIRPIGRGMVVDKRITGISPPPTLDGFTDLVLDLHRRIAQRPPRPQLDKPTPPSSGITVEVDDLSLSLNESAALSGTVPTLSNHARPIRLPGTVCFLEREAFKSEYLLVRHTFTIDAARPVRIMFNARQECWVWIDGKYAFGREGGRMFPAVHIAPLNQFIDLDLAAGTHQLIACIRRPAGKFAEWVIAICDGMTHQWLPGAF